jgi:hypothetical protein
MSQQPFSSDNGFSTTGNITALGNLNLGNTGANSSLNMSGGGAGNVLGYPTLLSVVSDNIDPYAITVQNATAGLGKGLGVYVEDTGNVRFETLGNSSSFNFTTGPSPYNIWTLGPDGNLSAPGNISTTGNITAGYLVGNGSQLTGVTATANTGNVTFNDQIVIGTGISNLVSGLYLSPSSSSANAVQYLRVRGDVTYEPTHIHFDTGNNQYFNQFIGDDNKYVLLSNTGNIVINTDDYVGNAAQWTFGSNGNLTLPSGGNLIVSGAIVGTNASPAPYLSGFDSVSALTLSATGNITCGNIVLNGGNITGANIVGANTVSSAGNISINANGNIWNFDTTGDLTFPTGNLIIFPKAEQFGNSAVIASALNNLITLSTGANGGLSSLWVEDYENIGTSNIAAVYANPTPGSGIVRIAVGANGNAGPNLWDFDTSGNATFPANGTTNLHDVVSVGLATFSNVQIGGNLNYEESANLIVVEDKDGFADIIAQNKNAGGNASMNIVLVNNDPGNVYMTIGVNSSTFTPLYNTLFEIPDAGYCSHSTTQVMGPQSSESGESRMFLTYSSGSYALELNDHGAIGWGASYNGNLTQGNFGNVGQVLTSAGANSPPTWNDTLSVVGNVLANNVIVTTGLTVNGTPIVANNAANLNSINTMTTTGNVSIGGNLSVTGNIIGNGAGLTGVAKQTVGLWTVTPGTATYSFTVPAGTYAMWVSGNIPNGIIVWNATATITNTNVPVVGQQYAWVYNGGGTPIDFVSIPNQFVGTGNTIVRSNTAPSSTTNRFDFSINNTSGGNANVSYGYTAL